MLKLTKKDFAAAADFIKSKARPLEAALFAVQFEEAPVDEAVFALAAYQNNDGGFGNGLEADIQLPDSSVIATATAFPHFRTLLLNGGHPMVAAACDYLNRQYLVAEKRWRIIPENIDAAPHAPWWVVGGDLWNSRVNPTAEILGFLYEYPQQFDAALRDALTQQLVSYAEANGQDAMEMHDLMCYAALVNNPSVPEDVRLRFLPAVRRIAEKTVERAPEKWGGYGLMPLMVVDNPHSPLAGTFAHEIPQNLDYLVKSRGEDGAWHPAWQWGDGDTARRVTDAWSGVITLNNLVKLRAFGRIAGQRDD